jgi:hypothetical protein
MRRASTFLVTCRTGVAPDLHTEAFCGRLAVGGSFVRPEVRQIFWAVSPLSWERGLSICSR